MRLPTPAADAITRMEETLDWLRWLDASDASLAASDWRTLESNLLEVGLARTAANQRWLYALCVIAWKLSGREPPRRRSRQYVIEHARAAKV